MINLDFDEDGKLDKAVQVLLTLRQDLERAIYSKNK
jgi:hypothetical protein